MKGLIVSIIAILLISCSSDSSPTDSQSEVTSEELLVNGSPWTFLEYRIDVILNTDGVDLMDSDLESQIDRENRLNDGLTLTFESDGTGITNQPSEFQWELIPNDTIRLIFDENEISVASLLVSESEMILGFEDEFEVRIDDGTIRGIGINASIVFN